MGATGDKGGEAFKFVELYCARHRGLTFRERRCHQRSVVCARRMFFLTFITLDIGCGAVFAEDNWNFLFHGLDRVDGVHDFWELDDFLLVSLTSSFGVVELHVVFVFGQVAGG